MVNKSDNKTPIYIQSIPQFEQQQKPISSISSKDGIFSSFLLDLKKKMMGTQNDVEDVKRIEENGGLKEIDANLEVKPVERSDNAVLRKLLRGPRYFDPPDSGWAKCYNCGDADHSVVNCTAAKRKKPCYVCGSLEHNAKQCKQGKGCFICKKGGHRAKNCPEKSKEGFQKSNFCLKCGDSGHDMFTCRSLYSPDDLKEIQCYICKCFGHLCCVNNGEGLSEVSCYRCGQLGHSGLECASAHAETTNTASPSSCPKCGEEGHKACKCPKSAKKRKRKGTSRLKQGPLEDDKDHAGVKSAPHDLGEARKKNKRQHKYSTSSQPKRSGDCISEDHGDNYNGTQWGSPSTEGSSYRSKNSFHYSHVASGSDSAFQFEASGSNGYRHSFSASRFGNSRNDEKREYGWDN